MKKWIYTFLAAVLLIPTFSGIAHANTGTFSYAVPISLQKSFNSSQTIPVDVPSDVNTIDFTSFTFNGTPIPQSAITYSGGKLTVAILGIQKQIPSQTVYGYADTNGKMFSTNPADAIWRYSDGRHWQINWADRVTLQQYTRSYVPATDSSIPSSDPPNYTISTYAQPLPPPSAPVWFDGPYGQGNQLTSQTDLTPADVDTNTIKLYQVAAGDAYAINVAKRDDQTIVADQQIPRGTNQVNPLDLGQSSVGSGGYVQGRNYYVTLKYNVQAVTKPKTFYTYTGSITYTYDKNPDPYVTAAASNDKSSVQFQGSDVTVTVTGKGTLSNYTDVNGILEWKLFSKVSWDGGTTWDNATLQKNVVGPGLTATTTFNFIVPAAKISAALASSSSYKVAFKVTPIAVLKQVDATNTNVSYQDTAYTYSVFANTLPPAATTPPQACTPPTAILQAPSTVAAGDIFVVDGSGSFAAGGASIVGYDFSLVPSDTSHMITTSSQSQSLDQTGTFTQYLTVKDSSGCLGATSTKITVTPPYPRAHISYTGTLKENRKITLVSQSYSPFLYPINSYSWTITPISGGTSADIKIPGSLNMSQEDLLIKKAGDYDVGLTVTNTAGYTDTTHKTITIATDLPPIADFTGVEHIFRDPNDQDYGTFHLTDQSYSADGDTIVQRAWSVIYDANNDGIFNEAPTVIDNTNLTTINYRTNQVGNYEFILQVVEGFGQPILSQYITSSDTKTAVIQK